MRVALIGPEQYKTVGRRRDIDARLYHLARRLAPVGSAAALAPQAELAAMIRLPHRVDVINRREPPPIAPLAVAVGAAVVNVARVAGAVSLVQRALRVRAPPRRVAARAPSAQPVLTRLLRVLARVVWTL